MSKKVYEGTPDGEVRITMKATRRITFTTLWMILIALFALVCVGLFRCATAPHEQPLNDEARCLEWVTERYEDCVQHAKGVIGDDHEYRLMQLCEESLPKHRAECQSIMGAAPATTGADGG
jgi:hypothetical protein